MSVSSLRRPPCHFSHASKSRISIILLNQSQGKGNDCSRVCFVCLIIRQGQEIHFNT